MTALNFHFLSQEFARIHEFQEKASSRAMFIFFLSFVKNCLPRHKLINTFVNVVKVKREIMIVDNRTRS